MAGTDGAQLQGLVGDQIVYAALAAIHRALDQALTAPTDSQRQRQLAQLRGVLLSLPAGGLSLEGALRHLIGVLQEPILDR
jgi:hypothetical protein